MRGLLRKRPSHGTVVAYLALAIALGGTSYAVTSVGSKGIRDNSIRSVDVQNNELRGRDIRDKSISGKDIRGNRVGGRAIKESSLGTVPRATAIEGFDPASLKLRCPLGTVALSGTCIETATRQALNFNNARALCAVEQNRRLPDYAELRTFTSRVASIDPNGEWTLSVYEGVDGPDSGTDPDLKTVIVKGGGSFDFAQAEGLVQRPFRCVALPSN